MASILKKHYFKDHHRPTMPVDGRCKKHPKHRQSPGVCSVCLREKLCQLASIHPGSRRTNNISTTTRSPGSSTTSSLSSYYSSSSCSSCSSPMQYRCRTYNINNAREGKGLSMSSFLLSGNINVLKKSRSMAFAIPRSTRSGADKDGSDDQKRKSGFWSKLLIPQGNKRETFMHSRTVRERVH
ncbi:uncharacterized protein LOC21395943 [Morus notabilis]|nr:uncharacterized protein LOC21395943 [Morus notabilis]